ncbi:MAG: malectin domain-containing carbohydrate-binding protein [Candidatus Acidiferrales bacterium]
MKKRGIAVYALGLALLLVAASLPALAQVSITMQHNDLNRSGDNLNETVLTTSNVNSTSFGLLQKITVDNQVYATPLVVAGLTIGGGTHNVVYAATTNNSVYAFDADSGTQYWHVNLGTPISNANYGTGCVDINGNAGIVGTPVIDTSNNTIYVVNSLNNPSGTYSFQLHALSLTTGADNSGSPVAITATGFQALLQNQRAALVLANGNLYIPFSSHCDMGAYHGYLMSYNPTTLAQIAVFNTSPTGHQDSLWESGQGPAVDSSGNIYFGTSNGTWDGVSNFSESFIKLNPNLTLADWFTAANHATLDGGDLDLDTSGPLLIPGSTRLFMVGKSGTGYVINSANLGHLGDASAVQTVALGPALHGSAVYFNSAANGPEVYTFASGDHLKAFQYNGNDLNTPNFQQGPDTSGDPGGYLAVSANGTSNGIVWANAVLSGGANHNSVPGVLRAYAADNIATELYNNQQNASRDSCDNYSKNGNPVVANGKVYLGSFGTTNVGSGELCIYGLITSCTAPTAPSGLSGSAVSAGQVSLTWTAGTTICAATYSIFRSTTSGFTPSVANQIASGVGTTSYMDDTAGAGTTYYYLVEEVNGGGASGPSNQASATTPALGSQLLAIDSGSTTAVSPFVADEDFTGGGTINHANTIDLSHVTNPAPAAVYQTARDGNFTYTIPGFTAGTNYLVRLHFCETFFSTAGSRVGNVSINGTPVLTNFDVFAASGAQNRAIIEQFLEPANSSGQFVIAFTSVVNNSIVSGIEIDSSTSMSCTLPTAPSALGATAISSSQINLSWTASSSSCSVTYNVYRSTTSGFTPSSANEIASSVSTTSYSDTGLAASTTYYYLVEGTNSGGTSGPSNQASATTSASSGSCTSICIDSGSTTAVSPFVADEDFTGGTTIDHANTINTSMVTNPAPAAVYQTARVANFTYTIGGFTASSMHNVRLHFCETYFSTTGSRTFNVSINGTQVLTDFDIVAASGGKNIANIQQFSEAANSSGQYVIVFTSVVNQSLISGIEID